MRVRILRVLLATLVSTCALLAGVTLPNAVAVNDLSTLVDQSSIGMNRFEDPQYNSHIGTITEAKSNGWLGDLKFKLHKQGPTPTVAAGDILKVGLTPVDPGVDLVRIGNRFRVVDKVSDSATGTKLADVTTEARRLVVFKFADVAVDFTTSQVKVPFFVNTDARDTYFEANPSLDQVDVAYNITIDGQTTGKQVTYRIKKTSFCSPY